MVRPCSCPRSERCLCGCTKDKEPAMADAPKQSIAFVGIDIGMNSFHVVGLDECGAIVLRQKWSRGRVEARFANMVPCLISLCRRAPSQPRAPEAWPRCPVDACAVRSALFEGTEERLPRRRGHCRSGATPDDEVRRDQDRRSPGPFRRCTACESVWSRTTAPVQAASSRSAGIRTIPLTDLAL